MNSFSESVQAALKYYVYALVDPRDNKIFYIGKGKGNRVFAHVCASIKSPDKNLKLNLIRDILDRGLEVQHYIVRHNLDEQEAYLLESTLIDVLTYGKFNMESVLTNVVRGHHQWDEGIMTCDELSILYDCAPIEASEKDGMLLVSLNNSFNQAKASGVYHRVDIYEATRKYWYLGTPKELDIKYVLGVYKGIVRSVVAVVSYDWVDKADDGTVFKKTRCRFYGELLGNSPFLNKSVSAYPFGSGGAVRYIR